MRKLLIIVTAALLLGACAYNPPAPQVPDAYARTVADAPAVAWQKAAAALTARGYALIFADKSLGALSTVKRVVAVTPAQVDCGNIWGLPYVADKRTVVSVALSVHVAPDGGGSRITVASDIDGNFVAMAGAAATHLSCRSLGALERDIISAL